ncbi:hypothetical protein QYE76_028560 [Lolium multiflorum]|uniref:CCHC-type domain-containing protein n=1 Tax=Lolium multiflorum TaxID=4521 RepID=A0AAD8QNX0_LOLMU|nr:hypothetical protein QYE76_028560 [Lolium multiflorum]
MPPPGSTASQCRRGELPSPASSTPMRASGGAWEDSWCHTARVRVRLGDAGGDRSRGRDRDPSPRTRRPRRRQGALPASREASELVTANSFAALGWSESDSETATGADLRRGLGPDAFCADLVGGARWDLPQTRGAAREGEVPEMEDGRTAVVVESSPTSVLPDLGSLSEFPLLPTALLGCDGQGRSPQLGTPARVSLGSFLVGEVAVELGSLPPAARAEQLQGEPLGFPRGGAGCTPLGAGPGGPIAQELVCPDGPAQGSGLGCLVVRAAEPLDARHVDRELQSSTQMDADTDRGNLGFQPPPTIFDATEPEPKPLSTPPTTPALPFQSSWGWTETAAGSVPSRSWAATAVGGEIKICDRNWTESKRNTDGSSASGMWSSNDAEKKKEGSRNAGAESSGGLLPHLRICGGRDSGRGAGRVQGSAQGERAPQARSSSEGGATTASDAAHIICYNCGKPGHFQAECKDEPFCLKCNKDGHLSAMCASLAKASEPYWAGFGCDGVGFTCCDMPEEELLPPAPNAALVILENGSLSAEQMEEELKDLVDEEWDWHVQKLNESDFAMFFPSKESLRMAIRGGGLTLPTSKLHVIVTTNSGDPAAAEQLVEVWVKLFEVPPPYRQAVRILLAARELGRPIAVDEQSLDSPLEPVRLLVGYKPSTRLPPHFLLFVNSQGFKVRVVPELAPSSIEGSGPPPPPPRHTEDKDDDPEESEGDGWDGRRGEHNQKAKEATKTGAGPSVPPKRKSVPLTGEEGNSLAAGPKLPASAMSQYGSNLAGEGDIFPVLAKIVQQVADSEKQAVESAGSGSDQSPPSPSIMMDSTSPEEEDGSPRSRPSLWKAQRLSVEDREEAGIESPISWDTDPEAMLARERRSKSNADRPSLRRSPARKEVAIQLDFSEEQPKGKETVAEETLMEGEVIAELTASVTRAPRRKSHPPVAARTIARGAGSSSIPIMEKAMQRAKDKVPAETSLGSDHTPLIFDSGKGVPPKSNMFFFETGWLEIEGFQDLLQDFWGELSSRVRGRDIVDWWKFMSTGLRQKLKGWNANKGRENRDHKQLLIQRIKELDEKADAVGIVEDEWAFRYHLEEQLLAVFRREEEYWRQREKELEDIVMDMKSDTAPGPDGFPVHFFKKFWNIVKHGVLHILNDFILGRIDIARLNFGVLSLIPKGGSQFWRSIHKIKHFFKLGARYKVRDGQRTLFWLDKWHGDRALKDKFPRLFDIALAQGCSVQQVCGGSTQMGFRRALDAEGLQDWQQLRDVIENAELSEGQDEISWDLEQSGRFSVSSMYRKLSAGASIAHFKDVWAARIPLKVRIFSWQLVLDRLPSSLNIAARHGPGNGRCSLCGVEEDASHIFFGCSPASDCIDS